MKNIAIVLLMAGFPGCYGRPDIKTGLEGTIMPPFNLLLLDSITQLNTNSIPAGKSIVFFYFSTSCPYCRALTEEISNEMQTLQNIRFYMLGTDPISELKSYAAHYKLEKFTNVVVGQDYANYFGNYFKVSGTPYMAIFSKDKRLRQVLIGKVSTNTINNIALN